MEIGKDILPLVQRELGGLYEIEREIGRGGAARVFLARNTAGESVALKVLHPQLAVSVTADRFLREVALLKKLDHPFIARFLDFGQSDWLIYFVMTYVDGPSLKYYLGRKGTVPLDDALIATCNLLDALNHAHDLGIVHRDVKPDNIGLSRNGAILLDFGVAKAIESSGTEQLTRSGFTIGTSHYMSPEQALGAPKIDHRSDIYALGCVFFECLAGRPPFVDRSEFVVLRMHQEAEIPDVRKFRSDVPESVALAISRAMQKKPEDRWQTANEMKTALIPHVSSQ
ncbi:MAG: serine/threonine-protein kinase [Gemmatimonadetes bacterium]|nr:serine/threonine-protein kinase [Gemmatimonadota bacterium]